jgi:hypothetical protein
VRLVGKQADPSGVVFRLVEAWTAKISLDLDSKMPDMSFREERGGAVATMGLAWRRVQCRKG